MRAPGLGAIAAEAVYAGSGATLSVRKVYDDWAAQPAKQVWISPEIRVKRVRSEKR